MITTTKNFSEKVKVSALNTFFSIWLFTITVATVIAVLWGVLPEFL
ncbi:hypothetical protein [Psychrobacter sp. UBA3480]|nr:hypothetical protein [Psychrobacter sp. UBA3480]